MANDGKRASPVSVAFFAIFHFLFHIHYSLSNRAGIRKSKSKESKSKEQEQEQETGRSPSGRLARRSAPSPRSPGFGKQAAEQVHNGFEGQFDGKDRLGNEVVGPAQD